jgi:hypothetical protein
VVLIYIVSQQIISFSKHLWANLTASLIILSDLGCHGFHCLVLCQCRSSSDDGSIRLDWPPRILSFLLTPHCLSSILYGRNSNGWALLDAMSRWGKSGLVRRIETVSKVVT